MRRRRPWLGAGCGLLAAWGCGTDAVHTLGQFDATPRFRDAGAKIRNINSDADDQDPTLTQDMLEIYFISNRPGGLGGGDVWYATRSAREQAFGAPALLEAASSSADETGVAISPDGNTLWVGSRRPEAGATEERQDLDIWRTQRAARGEPWGPLVSVRELNSSADDIPRPLGLNQTVMPMASKRSTETFQTYMARRATPDAAFEAEPDLLEELSTGGRAMHDGFMTDDGLLLFFNRAGESGGELSMAWRGSLDEPFDGEVLLEAVNTVADERDPWLDADGTRFAFASDRDPRTGLDIYMTFVELPRVLGLSVTAISP